MLKHSNWSRHWLWILATCVVLAVLLISCGQPPSPTPTQAAKASPTKDAKPAAKAVAPGEKVATPEAKAAKPAAKEPAKEEKKLAKIKVGNSAVTGSHAPVWVAKEKGLFEKYGLDVEFMYVQNAATLMQAMIAGEVPLGTPAGGALLSANLAGADVPSLAGTTNVIAVSLYAQPNIQRVEDFKGKTLGVTRFGSNSDYATRYVLKQHGLEPDKDVAIVQTGGLPEGLAALQSGGVQGHAFGPPTSVQARKLGMRELVNVADLGLPYAGDTIAVSRKYLSSDRATIVNFMKGYLEGIATAKKDKAYAMTVVGQYTKTNDREVLEETWELYTNKLLAKVPYTPVEAIQAVLDALALDDPKAKGAKPESFIDNSILKELDDSGFIKKLYE